MTSWYRQNPTGRFGDRADLYRAHRPSYPAAAIDAIVAGLGDPARLLAADIGAGTGISARLLGDRGVRTIAIEPNAPMRAAADPHPLVEFRPGTAEATGLADRSIDLVLVAQAFHWFDPDRALAEIRRIVGPGARLAIMWNRRDEEDPATAAYSGAIGRAAGKTPEQQWTLDGIALAPHFLPVRELTFAHEQALDEAGLLGRAFSASYVPKEGPAAEALRADLGAVHAAFRDVRGLVHLRYRTRLYLTEPA